MKIIPLYVNVSASPQYTAEQVLQREQDEQRKALFGHFLRRLNTLTR